MSGDFDEFLKNRRFIPGKVGEYLTVELYVGMAEPGNKFVIGKVVLASGGSDLYLPQSAELALLLTTTLELMGPGMKKCFFGGAVLGLAAPHKTLCVLKQVLTSLVGCCSSFDSGHGLNIRH